MSDSGKSEENTDKVEESNVGNDKKKKHWEHIALYQIRTGRRAVCATRAFRKSDSAEVQEEKKRYMKVYKEEDARILSSHVRYKNSIEKEKVKQRRAELPQSVELKIAKDILSELREKRNGRSAEDFPESTIAETINKRKKRKK